MEKLYFANKVLESRAFIKYAKYHSDQIGCHVDNYYFLDNKIYVFKLIDGKYVNFDGEHLDMENESYFELSAPFVGNDIIWCQDCDKCYYYPSGDCNKHPSDEFKCVGIVNVEFLTNLLRNYDPNEAIEIVQVYNAHLKPEKIMVPLDNLHKGKFNSTTRKTTSKVRRYLRKNK